MTGLIPPISVVIPARDAATYLSEAIDSVRTQTVDVREIIVVDDGSSDDTAAIATSFGEGVRCIGQRRAGAGAARNRGIDASTGALIAFLDADDVWPPWSLAVRSAALLADERCDAVLGQVEQFVCDRLTAAERQHIRIPRQRAAGWLCGAMLARRTVFQRLGRFPENRRAGEFLEWYLAAGRAGLSAVMLDDLVVRRRIHRSNLGRTDPGARADYLRIVRADLQHRRRTQPR